MAFEMVSLCNTPVAVVYRYYFLADFRDLVAVFLREAWPRGADRDCFFVFFTGGGGSTLVSYGTADWVSIKALARSSRKSCVVPGSALSNPSQVTCDVNITSIEKPPELPRAAQLEC